MNSSVIHTVIDPSCLNIMTKILKRNDSNTVIVTCVDKVSYFMSYDKENKIWCIKHCLSFQVQDILERRRLRNWLNSLENIVRIELVHSEIANKLYKTD